MPPTILMKEMNNPDDSEIISDIKESLFVITNRARPIKAVTAKEVSGKKQMQVLDPSTKGNLHVARDFVIEAEGLTKKYGDLVAVNNISLNVRRGEIFSLLGPNGAGKTTTIRMLTTTAAINSGRATIAGHDVAKDPDLVRSSIGVVPQELVVDNELKGIENILLSARLHHVPKDQARSRSGDLLGLFDLQDSASKPVKTYSGGMKRRLQLAMGLIHMPSVLFLDEPTVGLDIQTRTKIWDYIRQLNREQDLTVFMTTHYMEEADVLSDKIAIVDHGIIRESGSPLQLKEKIGADILTLSVENGVDVTSFLEGFENVIEVFKNNDGYRVKLRRAENAVPEIVERISHRGLKIKTLSFAKPSLDEVFLEVTGRSMRDAEQGATGSNGQAKWPGGS